MTSTPVAPWGGSEDWPPDNNPKGDELELELDVSRKPQMGTPTQTHWTTHWRIQAAEAAQLGGPGSPGALLLGILRWLVPSPLCSQMPAGGVPHGSSLYPEPGLVQL